MPQAKPERKPAEPKPLRGARPQPAVGGESVFARRVLERAEQLGLSKRDLASRADLSRQTLDNVLHLGHLRESRMPSIRTLLCLATALKVHPYWLVDGLMHTVPLSMHVKAQMAGDRAAFVEDVTSPDACVVAPGQHFFKAWTAQNLSGTTWVGRRIRCWDDQLELRAERLDGSDDRVSRLRPDVLEYAFGDVPGGAVFGGVIGFTAPVEPGPAASYWVLTESDGSPSFGENIAVWVVVVVEPDADKRAAWPRALNSKELKVPAIGLARRLG